MTDIKCGNCSEVYEVIHQLKPCHACVSVEPAHKSRVTREMILPSCNRCPFCAIRFSIVPIYAPVCYQAIIADIDDEFYRYSATRGWYLSINSREETTVFHDNPDVLVLLLALEKPELRAVEKWVNLPDRIRRIGRIKQMYRSLPTESEGDHYCERCGRVYEGCDQLEQCGVCERIGSECNPCPHCSVRVSLPAKSLGTACHCAVYYCLHPEHNRATGWLMRSDTNHIEEHRDHVIMNSDILLLIAEFLRRPCARV